MPGRTTVISVTRSKRWWWAVGTGVVVLLAGALLWTVDNHRDAREDDLLPSVRASLTTMARDAIEGGASSRLSVGEGSLACAVRVLGTDPPAVADAAQARSVYAWVRCATVGTETSAETSLPVAVHLTNPPSAEVPGDGSQNGPDTERIFPERLWDQIDAGSLDGYGLEPEMRQRVRERT